VNEYVTEEHEEGVVIVNDVTDLTPIVADIMRETGFVVYNLNTRCGRVVAFMDPISNVTVECGSDYKEREEVSDRFFEEFRSPRFIFTNQTWGCLGWDYLTCLVGEIPPSRYSRTTADIVDTYEPKPLMQTLGETTELIESRAFDIRRCYSSVARDNEYPYPVYTEFDDMIPYDGHSELPFGEYMVEQFYFYGILFNRCLWSRMAVDYLLAEGLITRAYITHVLVARKRLPADLLHQFMVNNVDRKLLMNVTIGRFNCKHSSKEQAFVTTNSDVVSATVLLEEKSQRNCRVISIDGVYCVFSRKRTRRIEDHSSIWRQIICGSLIAVLKLMKLAVGPRTQVIGINVDCLYVNQPNHSFLNQVEEGHEAYRLEEWHPKNLSYLPVIAPYYWRPLVWHFGSGLVTGMGGSGKTRWIVRRFKELNEGHPGKVRMFAFTNNAVNLLIYRGRNFGVTRSNTMTLSKWAMIQRNHPLPNPDYILVDEMSMIPKSLMSMLYNMFRKGTRIILVGDPNQCRPVENDGYYEWENSRLVHEMVGGRLQKLPYIEGCSRFDRPLFRVIEYLLEHKRLHPCLREMGIDRNLEVSICKYNRTRKTENSRWCPGNRFEEDSRIIIEDPKGKLKTIGVYNSSLYRVQSLEENGLYVEGVDDIIPYEFVEPGNCVTCYKRQGSDLAEPHNIFDVRYMTLNELMTALTRARRLSDIHLTYTDKVFTSPDCTQCTDSNPIAGGCRRLKVFGRKVFFRNQSSYPHTR